MYGFPEKHISQLLELSIIDELGSTVAPVDLNLQLIRYHRVVRISINRIRQKFCRRAQADELKMLNLSIFNGSVKVNNTVFLREANWVNSTIETNHV